jgi:hypothetical protein
MAAVPATLDLYRDLVPEHVDVDSNVILAKLSAAVRRHSLAALGDVAGEAMVWYAAHLVQLQPGSGAPGAPSSGSTQGPLISQRDGDISRTYAGPSSSSGGGVGSDAWWMLTTYGSLYLDLIRSRAETAPFVAL